MISKVLALLVSGMLFTSINHPGSPEEGPKVYIATFKNDAEGAYTLIHDDFGGDWARGIEEYADTMAFNRGIPFCFALISGQCDNKDWKNANQMIAHGHQVVNHSMYHKCGRDLDWCTGGKWDEHDFGVEIDSSTSLIKQKTGFHPAFFMFPFDIYTDTMISYLRYRGYAGARAGSFNATQSPEIEDPLYLNFKAYSPQNSLRDLNSLADQAIQEKSWGIREVHGVNDASWGKISLRDYEAHMKYLQALSRSDSLWVGTLSDVLTYEMLRKKYTPIVTQTDEHHQAAKIEFTAEPFSPEDSLIWSAASASTKFHTVTLVLAQHKHKISKIMQEDKKLAFRKKGEKILVDVNPAKGALTLIYK